ncbi:MAG TPA: radical SAM protein [Phycisphaerae bacterium]|nr:radical SAM protein [Phycisphaerae bacterium]
MNPLLGEELPETAEAKCTYAGRPIPPLARGLPKEVESVCPECLRLITAHLFEKDGKVRMEKTCPDHGRFEDIVWSDARIYLKAEQFHYADGDGVENPNTRATSACPNQCGLCEDHASNTALGNIDLTNRCDLQCPICFANSGAAGYVYEPTFDQVLRMLGTYRAMRPSPARAIQFSGGEPTLHPRFLDCLRAACQAGFSHIQIATNGLRFAREPDFARECQDAGLHDVYLQFDGTTDDVWEKTRGRGLMKEKEEAVRRISRTDMKIVLVPTIVRGLNDHQVGDIVRYALERIGTIAGISFQPVAFTGRIDAAERLRRRYTLTDLAHDVAEQAGIGDPQEDWFPLSCVQPFTRLFAAVKGEPNLVMSCHPHCALGTYLFVGTDGRAVPIPQFFNLKGMLDDMWALAEKTERSRFKLFRKVQAFLALRRHFRPDRAPAGMTFDDWLHTLNGMTDKRVGRGKAGRKTFRSLLVAGMHFQDRYNYQTDRVRRCVIHYADPDGRLYPFCTYNAGPEYRYRVEKKFAMTPEEYRARQADHDA